MKRFTMFACLALTLAFALNAYAVDYPQRALGHDSVFHGGSTSFAKDVCDTIFLIGPWGSGAQVNGQFEDQFGNPSWNGWYTYDITAPTETHWQVSDYAGGIDGSLAAYCGDETIESCGEGDPEGGYGNSWNDILQYSYVVADPFAGCVMNVTGTGSSNSEEGYDFANFRFITSDGPVTALVWDGIHTNEAFDVSHSYAMGDYVGINGDEVRFQFQFTSDGGYSDADCLWTGDGGIRVDNLTVTATNGGLNDSEDFNDGEFGNWTIEFPAGVGDYGKIWQNLEDFDPCFTNYTAQVAFINDGTLVEGVPASECTNWCYGPGGYIVNTTGGASDDPDAYLYNALESPVVDWPADPAYIGGDFTFGIYRHEDLSPDSPGMFYTWSIRSAVDGDDITTATWEDRGFVYYGGPDYIRAGDNVTDLLTPGLTQAQVQVTAYELGWVWNYIGDDGTPAPYFDNIRLTAFCQEGPGMSTREIDLANDNWPAIQLVDMQNLAANSVRFDMANNKFQDETYNIPGDSIVVEVASVRAGGALVSNRLVYSMQRNPVFDSVRDPAWGATGFVAGQVAVNNSGVAVDGLFAYDLPDSGFLFPGDVLHYYIEATDEVAHANPQTATLPADITGFGDFSHPLAYNSSWTVRALPTVDSEGNTPGILFWNDFANRGGEGEWYGSLDNIGLEAGTHYDVYYTNGPSSGVGNGLGGRASVQLLSNYSQLLYTSGDLSAYTLSNGDPDNDPGNDVVLLTNWLNNYDVDAFFTGDDLVSDLEGEGEISFLNTIMNVVHVTGDIRTSIGSQTAPLVLPVAGNSVFQTTPAWVAYGGCRGINTFDGVEAGDGAERLARFTNDSGVASYDYSAATLNVMGNGNRIITLPYDFMYIHTDLENNTGDGLASRTHVLREVLNYFGLDDPTWNPTPVPGVGQFYAKNYPNPFNPTTKIEFNMPKAGHLTLKVYNVRGELVKTLIDEQRAAGADHIMWDGTNELGSPVSSGVYFYEARAAGEVSVNKMALVK